MQMQKIKIITDSASDIPQEQVKKYDIEIKNIPITIDGVSYRERADFTNHEFYQILLTSREIP
jgi:fatty acid-binding protein DegV